MTIYITSDGTVKGSTVKPPDKPECTCTATFEDPDCCIRMDEYTKALQRFKDNCIEFKDQKRFTHSWKCCCGCLNRIDIGTCSRCRGQRTVSHYYGDDDRKFAPDTILEVDLPEDFDKMIDWYNRPQTIKPKK